MRVPIFRYLLARRLFGFYRILICSLSVCLKELKFYYFVNSHARVTNNVRNLFKNVYQENIDQLGKRTVEAWINFAKRNEERK